MVANCEPAEEWLDIDEEDEGGEPVSLDDAPADRNGICDAASGGKPRSAMIFKSFMWSMVLKALERSI